jgi:HprK-related kinase A
LTSFELQTQPFSFRVHSNTKDVFSKVSKLYPSLAIGPVDSTSLVDFVVDFKRLWNGWRRPYNFRLGGDHFRMADTHDLLPCFEWGMNWCISNYQSYYLCIHAGVLEKDGVTLVLPAPPGSGKSTLCAMLMLRGWRLLSDEHCLIDPDTGMIVPCVRPISLKNRSVPLIQQLAGPNSVLEICDNTFKGTIGYLPPTERSWDGIQTHGTPSYVIFPKYSRTPQQTLIARIPQSQLFMHLAINSFNYQVMAEVGFNVMARLVQQVEGLQLEYHDSEEALSFIESLP